MDKVSITNNKERILKNIKTYFLFLIIVLLSMLAIFLLVDCIQIANNTKDMATKKVYEVEEVDEKQNLIKANGVYINKIAGVKQIQASKKAYYLGSDRVLYAPMDIILMVLKELSWLVASVILILSVILLKKRWYIILGCIETVLGLFSLFYFLYLDIINYNSLILMAVVCLAFIFVILRRGTKEAK